MARMLSHPLLEGNRKSEDSHSSIVNLFFCIHLLSAPASSCEDLCDIGGVDRNDAVSKIATGLHTNRHCSLCVLFISLGVVVCS